MVISRSQVQRDLNVVVECNKYFLFERNIVVPSCYPYTIIDSDIWVANLQSANRIIPKGMYTGVAEGLDKGHLSVIADALEGLNAQRETSKFFIDIYYSHVISPEFINE
ncbi:hypothetical protein NPIL_317051 [Nephila pilipes]|uniref:Uncharacterized protein n=1 Tax=Nephila pilipes TaxID=299642 RepID=A0A8X6KHT9_NEPPI|nr:hypothetical protein NPIL_317051 [Nephila pilipes]